MDIIWQENNQSCSAHWQSEANNPPPKKVVIADDATKADAAYKMACEGTALLYRGDFHNAKQLLQAITRRVDRKPVKPASNLTEAFHQHRARQIQRANITGKILIELRDCCCDLKRAPDVRGAVSGAIGDNIPAKMVLSLRELLGMIGAHEWRKKGVYIDALQANIHADFGVYSPVRGEYLQLIQQAPLGNVHTAFDIGAGTGVIAAILAKRGVKQVIATDNNSRALACARENITRLGLQTQVEVVDADLYPIQQKADLIVCNPPWLPAKANAPIEYAIYDPENRMLKGFLSGVKAHLNADGEAWLILSDLAEHLGLRTRDELAAWIKAAGMQIIEKLDIKPQHGKVQDKSDPLYLARSREVTSLYRLKAVSAKID